jgi:hypothetical protein
LYCSNCGNSGTGAFCVKCGTAYDINLPKSGQLFSERKPKSPKVLKSKFAAAAAIATFLSITASSIVLVMLNTAINAQSDSERLVSQYTSNLATAESAAAASESRWIDWMGCYSDIWLCNLIYGDGDDLTDDYIAASAQVDSYRSKLRSEKEVLADALLVTEQLTFNLQMVVIAGIFSTGSLLAAHFVFGKKKSTNIKLKSKKKVGK